MKKPILYLLVIGVALSLILPRSVSAATVNFTENPGNSWLSLNTTNNRKFFLHSSADGENLEFASYNGSGMIWQTLNINKGGWVGVGTNNYLSKFHVKKNGNAFTLEGDNHVYMQWYPDGASAGRKAWTGFGNHDQNYFTIQNEIPGGQILLSTNGGKVLVAGTLRANEIQVLQNIWADYVFEDEYKLLSLDEVEQFINTYKHLPNIPSAKEVEKNGISVGEMQRLQMEKIEELTLYSIQLNKDNQSLKKENEDLKARLEKIESILNIK